MEECFKFLVDSFQFTIGLRVIGGREGDVVVKEAGEFSGKGGGKLWTPVRDDSVMKTELGKDGVEKDVCNVGSGCHFVAGLKFYPLQKAMVYHNQNRVEAIGDGEVSDEIHGDLLKGVGALEEIGARGGWDGCMLTLLAWHVAHPAMNFCIKVVISGHQ